MPTTSHGSTTRSKEDITVTALYTSETWRWAGFEGAELMATPQARSVFRVTNTAMAIARLARSDVPSLRHGLAQRHAMIDRLLDEAAPEQVLELAAGLAARGATRTRRSDVRYVELDLPAMVARKEQLLARTDAGRADLARSSYVRVAGDARSAELEALVAAERSLAVVAEGLFMYLTPPEQHELWRRLARLLRRAGSGFFVFDLVPRCEQPPPGRIGRAFGRALRRATGGKGLELDDRTRADIVRDLGDCGFSRVELLEPSLAPSGWELPFLKQPTQVLLFRCTVPGTNG